MKTNKKKFNSELFNKFDAEARKQARGFIADLYPHIIIEDNPNVFGADLIAYKDGKIEALLEVEIRDSWNGEWPQSWSLQISERKVKYLNNEYEAPVYYMIFNKDCSQIIALKKPLDSYPIIIQSNKYVKNETSREIPANDCLFFYYQN